MASFNPNDPNPNNPANVGNSRPKGPRAGVNAPGPRGPQPQKNRQGEGQQVRLTGQTAEEIRRSIEQATETKLVNRGIAEKAHEARKAWSSPNQNFAAAQAEAAAAMAAAEAMHSKDEIALDGAASLMGEAISNRSAEAEDSIYVKPVKTLQKDAEFGIDGGKKTVKTKGKPLTNEGPDVRPKKVLRPEETPDKPNETIIGVDKHLHDATDVQMDTPVAEPVGTTMDDEIVVAAPSTTPKEPEAGITLDDPGIYTDYDPSMYMDDENQMSYDDMYAALYADDMQSPKVEKDESKIAPKETSKSKHIIDARIFFDSKNFDSKSQEVHDGMMNELDKFGKSSKSDDKTALTDLLSNINKAAEKNLRNYYITQMMFPQSRMNAMQSLGYLAATAMLVQATMGLKNGLTKDTPKEALEPVEDGGKFVITSCNFGKDFDPKNESDFNKYLQQHRDDIMIQVGEKLGISEEDMKHNNIYITDAVSENDGRLKTACVAYSGFKGKDAELVDYTIREAIMDMCNEYGDSKVLLPTPTYVLSKQEKAFCDKHYANIEYEPIRTYKEKISSIDKTEYESVEHDKSKEITLDASLSSGYDAAQERLAAECGGPSMG